MTLGAMFPGSPIRARMIGLEERLFDYPWSSFPLYAAHKGRPVWFEPRTVLGEMGLDDTAAGRRAYAERMRERAVDDPLSAVATSYAQWQSAHFSLEEIAAGLAAPEFDFNADGVANVLDYALARDPRNGLGGILPGVPRTGTGGRVRLAFTRDASRADLVYLVEASNDLAIWTGLARSVSGAATTSIGAAAAVSESGGVLKNVIVEDLQNPAASPERFLRLRITLP